MRTWNVRTNSSVWAFNLNASILKLIRGSHAFFLSSPSDSRHIFSYPPMRDHFGWNNLSLLVYNIKFGAHLVVWYNFPINDVYWMIGYIYIYFYFKNFKILYKKPNHVTGVIHISLLHTWLSYLVLVFCALILLIYILILFLYILIPFIYILTSDIYTFI